MARVVCAGAGRADHQDVVITGARDFQRALGGLLASDSPAERISTYFRVGP